jgi:hypothetical protein
MAMNEIPESNLQAPENLPAPGIKAELSFIRHPEGTGNSLYFPMRGLQVGAWSFSEC